MVESGIAASHEGCVEASLPLGIPAAAPLHEAEADAEDPAGRSERDACFEVGQEGFCGGFESFDGGRSPGLLEICVVGGSAGVAVTACAPPARRAVRGRFLGHLGFHW